MWKNSSRASQDGMLLGFLRDQGVLLDLFDNSKKVKLQYQIYSRTDKPQWGFLHHILEPITSLARRFNITYVCSIINLNHNDYKSIGLAHGKYQRYIWLLWFFGMKNQVRRRESHSRHGFEGISYQVADHFDPEILRAIKQNSEEWLCSTGCPEFCDGRCASN